MQRLFRGIFKPEFFLRNMRNIRAHHLLCIPRFYGGGYNRSFGRNLKKICFEIRKEPDIKIRVVRECDDICRKCPHKKGGICRKTPELNRWILAQDNKVLEKLKLKENSVHGARDIFNLSMSRTGPDNTGSICNSCVFLENCIHVGINNSFRRDLTKN